MKKTLIEILLLLIPFKNVRNRWRRILRAFELKDVQYFSEFCNRKFDKKRVLLIEPNDCHAEILPGYAKYFIDLGFGVDVLISRENIQDNPFCRFKDEINVYYMNPIFILFLRFSKILNQYEKIVVTSSNWYSWLVQSTKYLGIDKRNNLIVVEHDTKDIERFHEEKLVEENKLITLWNFDKGIMVNPHYFGEVETDHQKNEITNFIVVGGIFKQRKNFDLLINAVKELEKETDKFKITVVGEGNLDNVEERYHKFFDIKGRLNFSDMYQEMEKADFFLPLLDYENLDHHRYITTGVTGSVQLILGFLVPPVIQKQFADFYGFDETNSLIYNQNFEFKEKMLNAIKMSNYDYQNLKNSVKILSKKIYTKSKNNINKIINNYKIVSLGEDCLVRRYLTLSGLKPFKANGELSMVFDLAVHPTKSLIKILQSDFKEYFKGMEYQENSGCWYNTKYNILYNHDKDCLINDKQKLIKRFIKRIENFKQTLKNADYIYFVIYTSASASKLNKLLKLLVKHRNIKKFDLIVISTNNQLAVKHLDKKILLYNNNCPFPNKSDWWKPEYYNSDIANKYRESISNFVRKQISSKFTVIENNKVDVDIENGDY